MNYGSITTDWEKIENKARVERLIAMGWTWNQDQELNPLQLDAPEGETWYDATDDYFEIEDRKAICESCEEIYDYEDEPSEVRQGGTHICPTCWAKPE